MERFFFNDWVGKTIKRTTTDPPLQWTLDSKLSEKNSQWSAKEYHMNPPPGAAYGTFMCHNVDDAKDVTILRVLMQ
ncbi:hypothetical protein BJX63DRAFT_378706 [Aspergillus granulosus]|uniref:Uncharacterized protein n=1 Tax=Aspergillus granulosus TaxID=176169 RepID=A0ABR4I1J4_9EURO